MADKLKVEYASGYKVGEKFFEHREDANNFAITQYFMILVGQYIDTSSPTRFAIEKAMKTFLNTHVVYERDIPLAEEVEDNKEF